VELQGRKGEKSGNAASYCRFGRLSVVRSPFNSIYQCFRSDMPSCRPMGTRCTDCVNCGPPSRHYSDSDPRTCREIGCHCHSVDSLSYLTRLLIYLNGHHNSLPDGVKMGAFTCVGWQAGNTV